MRKGAQRALVMGLGAVFALPACLDLGGSWDPSATSATTTTASSSTTTGTTGTGTAGTGAGSSTGETETDGCSFLDCADMPIEYIECDLWEQDCPEGQKCAPWANDGGTSLNAAKCVPVVRDPDLPGEVCAAEDNGLSGVDTCDKGSKCWNLGWREKRCVSLCIGDPDSPQCPEAGFFCQIFGSGVDTFCYPACDPLVGECEDEGHQCQLSQQGQPICQWCDSGGRGVYGDQCWDKCDCAPGYWCWHAGDVPDCQGDQCCTPWCDTSAPNTCPAVGQVCISLYTEGMSPPGYDNLGFCGVPQP